MYNEKKMINCMYTLKEDEEYILKKIKDEFKWKMLDSEYDEKRIEITKNSDVLKQCIERGLFMEEVLNNPNLPSEYLENLLKDMTEFLCNSKFTQIKEIKNLCDKITKMHLHCVLCMRWRTSYFINTDSCFFAMSAGFRSWLLT